MNRFTKREKQLAAGFLALAALWALFALAVKPALERTETLKRVIPRKKAELKQLKAKTGRYIELRKRMDQLKKEAASKQQNFRLASYIESLLKKCDLSDKLTSMTQRDAPLDSNYNQTILEINIKKLSLSQLVKFLEKVHSEKTVSAVKSLYITKNKTDTGLLDTKIELRTISMNHSQKSAS